MKRAETNTMLLVCLAIISIMAIFAATYLLIDKQPDNDSQVAVILTFTAGLIAGLVVIFKIVTMGQDDVNIQLKDLHDRMNSRLDELLDATKKLARREGVEEGMEAQRQTTKAGETPA